MHKLSKRQLQAIHAQKKIIKIDSDNKPSNYDMWIVDMKTHQKIPGSESVIKSKSYGKAVDVFILDWNKKKRMGMTVGYPVVQGKIRN